MPHPERPTLVMGVINVTPDSFSGDGRSAHTGATVAHALRLIAEGADWIDIGGESTRPDAEPVDEALELERVIPVIAAVRAADPHIPLSIDTMKPAIARAAMAAGASLWNDVTALSYRPESLETAAMMGCEVCLMHMQGDPRTMQHNPRYSDVVGEVEALLLARAEAAMAAGVVRERIWLDPGIGFGKRLEHNLALLAHLDRLVASGYRILLGVSRKGFIRGVDPTAVDPLDRLGGGLAAALAGARAGVTAVRVHDVRETRQALAVQQAIDGRSEPSS